MCYIHNINRRVTFIRCLQGRYAQICFLKSTCLITSQLPVDLNSVVKALEWEVIY